MFHLSCCTKRKSRNKKSYKNSNRFLCTNEISHTSGYSPIMQLRRKTIDQELQISSDSEDGKLNEIIVGKNCTKSGRMFTSKNFKKNYDQNPINLNDDNNHDAFKLLISKLNKNLDKVEHEKFEHEYLEKVKNQWILLSKIIDRLLLYIFLIATSLIFGGILLQAPYANFFNNNYS